MTFQVRKLSDGPNCKARMLKRVATVLTVAQPIIGVYRIWRRKRADALRQKKRISMLKRVLLVLIALLIALLVLVGISKGMMSVSNLGVDKVVSVAGTPLPKDEHGFTNVLLMGQGHADHDGKNLTDTIMIASADPEGTKSTVMLSLPRDLYFLKTEKMGKGKLNSMYRDFRSYLIFRKGVEPKEASVQALRELGNEIGRSLGIEIHHVVKVDFLAFVKAVDTIGGIDIDVPYTIEDYEYPDENFGYEPFVVQAGMRHFDGATALKYARSRSTTSDFDRSARQQQLLAAMGHKAKTEGVLKDPSAIASFINIMKENVETTMSLRELVGAASLAQKLDREKVVSLQLNDRNALYDAVIEPGGMLYTPPRNLFDVVSVLLPVSIPEFPVTWKQPRALIDLLVRNRQVYLDRPVISVLNAGAPPGSARRLATECKRYGWKVTKITNADIPKREKSMVVTSPEPDPLSSFFGKLLSFELSLAPEGLPEDQKERITLILGKDYRYTPFQNLVENLLKVDPPPQESDGQEEDVLVPEQGEAPPKKDVNVIRVIKAE